MFRIRFSSLVAALLLATAVVLLTAPDAYPQPKPPAEESDNVVPVTTPVQTLPNVQLAFGNRTLKVSSIQYAQQGGTVYVFPVLVVAAVEVPNRSGTGWDEFPPDRPLPTKADGGVTRLRVKLVNLLAEEDSRAAVVKRLREHLADEPVKPQQIKQDLKFNPTAFRMTLAAPASTGDAGELALSRPAPSVGRFTVLNYGSVIFELLPENIARLQAANGEAVLLRDAYLKLSGEMWVRFEQQQYLANFEIVQTAVTSLQHDLQSIQPTGQPAPEVFVQVPVGGTVEGRTAVTAAFSQYLVGSVSVRKGAGVNPGVLSDLTERLVGRMLSQVELTDKEDGKRVAMMFGDRATLSATVGEIKSLAKQKRAEREARLKAALDDMESRRTGGRSEYAGAVGVQYGPIGGKVEAAYKNATEEEKAERRKQELETLHRGLDECARLFDGRTPTLSGIRFDQKALDAVVKDFRVSLEGMELKGFGWSPHDWTEIKLTPAAGISISPELLLRQVEAAKARYQELERFFSGKAEKVKELQELLREARSATEQAKANAERVAELAKPGTPAAVERRLKSLELGMGVVPRTVLKHTYPLRSVAFSPDGKTLATASDDGTARLWNAATGQERAVLKGHMHGVLSVVFSPDGKTLATASYDHTARLWDAATGAERAVLKGHSATVYWVAFRPDGKTLATASDDKTARLWDAATGAERAVLKGHTDTLWSGAFSPDGKTLATASVDKTARLWDAATGAERAVLKGHTYQVKSVAFSPDGKTLATVSSDSTARLWDAATGAERSLLKGHTDQVRPVAFSPDGETLATASDDKTARLWIAATGQERAVLKGHTYQVMSVAFSPDGKILATASLDNTVRLWDAATGVEWAVLKGHTDTVFSVAFGPNGKTLATASADHTLRLWDLYP